MIFLLAAELMLAVNLPSSSEGIGNEPTKNELFYNTLIVSF